MSDSLSGEMQKWLDSLTPEDRAILEVEVTPTQVIIEDLTGIQKAVQDKVLKEAKMFTCDYKEPGETNICGRTFETKQQLGSHKRWHTKDKSQMAAVRAARGHTRKVADEVDYKAATETLQKENADLYKEVAQLRKRIKHLESSKTQAGLSTVQDALVEVQGELEELTRRAEVLKASHEETLQKWQESMERELALQKRLLDLQERFINKLDAQPTSEL